MSRVCDDCIGRCEELHGKQRRLPVHRFFKFVLHHYNSQYMHLPPEFARRVTMNLADHETHIEDSDGKQWPVTLSDVGGSLAFQKGWGKFYSDHGLKAGHVLFFSYTEGSHFTVCIFSTSACERLNFNNEMSRRSKKRKRDIGTASEDGSHLTAGVNSKDKPISASGNEFLNHNVIHVAENADAIKASGNLSSMIPGITKKLMELQQLLDQVAGPILAETKQNVVISENTSGLKVNLSGNGALDPTNPEEDDIPMEQTTTTAEDAEMPLVDTDPVINNSSDSSSKTPEKPLAGKTADTHNEITEQISKKVDDTLMAPHSSQGGDHSCDASRQKSSEKPSDTCKRKMGMLNNDKHGPFSAPPPFIGTNNIMTAEKKLAVKSKFNDSVFSSADKNPKELPAIKKEVEMGDKLSRGGNEPAKVLNFHVRTSPVVKVDHSLDASTKMSSEKPSGTCKMKMDILKNVSDFQHGKRGSFSASPSIGTDKIAESEHVVKSKFGDSSAIKSPIEQRAIKKEVMMDDKLSCGGSKPAKVLNYSENTPLQVKVEPDLCGTYQLDAINPLLTCPFSAEVKSQHYLELPLVIDVASCRRWKARKHLLIFLRDSTRTIYPVVYHEYQSKRVLTMNWTGFCRVNNIKPGDECRFQAEDHDSLVFKVDVTRGSA